MNQRSMLPLSLPYCKHEEGKRMRQESLLISTDSCGPIVSFLTSSSKNSTKASLEAAAPMLRPPTCQTSTRNPHSAKYTITVNSTVSILARGSH